MKTITLTLPDEDFERVATDARIHGRTVEAEIAERIKPVDWSRRPLIADRDELARELDAFQAELRGRGICLADEELRAAVKEGRE
jgi:hypothetical protein